MKLLKDLLYGVPIEEVEDQQRHRARGIRQPGGEAVHAVHRSARDEERWARFHLQGGRRWRERSGVRAHADALAEGITYVRVTDAAEAIGLIASNFHDQPSKRMKLVGITGTNGKTSVATLLFRLFRALGHKCGLISTVEVRIGSASIRARTPPRMPCSSAR